MTGLAPDWRERVADPAQIARLDRFVRAEGPGRGDRVLQAVSGGGLVLDIFPDRCFDIGHASFNGLPLAWVAPDRWDAARTARPGMQWLRGFGGGLLTTCGLDSFGPPSSDGGREHGLHGPVSAQAGELLESRVGPEGIVIAGRVGQSALFGEGLTLVRRIEIPLGGRELRLTDRVTNEAVDPEGHMMLWHCNFGWPLLDEGCHVEGPGGRPAARDAAAERGLETWNAVHGPRETYGEQVFVHSAPGEAAARLVNPARGIAVRLDWDGTAMPAMFQWKMLRRRHYVMGLEPANTHAIMGRARARAEGALPVLAPGETVTYRLRLSVEVLS